MAKRPPSVSAYIRACLAGLLGVRLPAELSKSQLQVGMIPSCQMFGRIVIKIVLFMSSNNFLLH